MREHDVVELNCDVAGLGLRKGDKGTIVHVLAPGVFLTEFCDEQGVTLVLPELRQEQLRVVWSADNSSG